MNSSHVRRSSRLRPYLAAGSACALLLLTAACGGDESDTKLDSSSQSGKTPSFDLSGEKVRITFGDNSAQSLGNRYMVSQLKKWGADVDDITLTTATGLSAIIAGKADFAAGQGADEAVLGISKGTDLTAIGAPDSANSYVVIAKNELKSVDDLKGKRIATSGPGGFNTALMHVALQKSGIDPEKDTSLVTIGGSPERSAALLTGKVDATVVFFSDWAELKAKSDKIHLLASLDELVPNIPDLYYYGPTKYWKDHPEVATAVACANLSANAIISNDKDAFVKFATDTIKGSDKTVTSSTYDELMRLGNWPTNPDEIMNQDGLGGLVELMIQAGGLDEPTDTSKLVDLTYLEKAAEMGCGGGA
jgi:NitT/TauT family transport system substrate-binding protein